MIEVLKWLLLPLLGTTGWMLVALKPRLGCLLNWWAARGLLGIGLGAAVAGVITWPEGLHRGLAHLLVAATWCASPIGIGVFLQTAATGRQREGMVGAMAALVSLVAVLMAAVTGYLGPTRAAPGAMSLLRFGVLHVVAAPGFAAGALFLWDLSARRMVETAS